MRRKVVGMYPKGMTPEQKSSWDVPEGFAICAGSIPNEQHGSKARGVLPGKFARCGACYPADCM
ncbi:hypothetical protein CRG98_048885, partial [Punica granatum]